MANDSYYNINNHLLSWLGPENLYGYQECGLSSKTGVTATGLAATTQYYYKINIDGAGVVEFDITTGASATFDQIIALMNAENTGATWEIQGGDFRCRSDRLGASSTIVLSAGTTGADLFGTLTDFVGFDGAVAGRAYRTNLQGKDTANLVGDTFFRLPIRLLRIPLIYIKRNKVYKRVANTKFWGYIGHEGYQDGKMIITGDMIDLSMMYYLCKACTTTDNSPGASQYKHVYVTTTVQLSPPPTFQMLYELKNVEPANANDVKALYCGSVLSGVAISIKPNSPVQLTLDTKFAIAIAGNALTNQPTFGKLKNYHIDRTEITIKKGGVAYPGSIRGADIVWNDGTILHKQANAEYASEAINGNPDIQVRIDFAAKDETYFEDMVKAPLAPATASDVDIVVKMYRSSTLDYTEFVFEKCWNIDSPDGEWSFEIESVIMMQHVTTFIVKPATFETGAKITLTEQNVLDDDRYET